MKSPVQDLVVEQVLFKFLSGKNSSLLFFQNWSQYNKTKEWLDQSKISNMRVIHISLVCRVLDFSSSRDGCVDYKDLTGFAWIDEKMV